MTKTRSAWFAVSALMFTSLAAPACGSCNCPSGGQIAVPFPPAQVNPIVSLSADSRCTAMTTGTDGQIDVRTDEAGTCDVHVQLKNGDRYSFTVVFQSVDQGCCGGVVGKAQNLVPQALDAGTGAQDLPIVPAGCGTTCSTAAGPEDSFVDAASVAAALAGRWRICGSWPGGLPNGVVGVELYPASASMPGPDGGVNWEEGEGNLLVSGASGPVLKTDFGYLLTWRVNLEQTVAGPKIYLSISTGPGQGVAGYAHYSACPMKIAITLGSRLTDPIEATLSTFPTAK